MKKWMEWFGKRKLGSILTIVIMAMLATTVLYGSATYRFDVPKGLTVGDILYANRTDRMTNLNSGTSGYVLTANGAGAAPSYQAVAGTVTNLTANKPVFSDASQLLVSTGTVPADQGGTGQSAYAVGDIPYASATTPTISKLTIGLQGKVMESTGTIPSYVAKNIYRQAAIHNFATAAASWTLSADELLCLMHATTNATGAACTIQAAGTAGMVLFFRNGSGQNNTVHSGSGTGVLISTATAIKLVYDGVLSDWVKMGTAVAQP
jgi:hypothetical protein